MSAAWLPVFPYLHHHRKLVKLDMPPGIFATEVLRPVVGLLLYAVSGLFGWFVSPVIAVGIFIFVVAIMPGQALGFGPAAQARDATDLGEPIPWARTEFESKTRSAGGLGKRS